ncbi:extracellular solute-binding protein [Desulfobacterales bacterium HSG2]|nr:extracellular solute-binding protein [Desulfobacterales bacterium HSG2]
MVKGRKRTMILTFMAVILMLIGCEKDVKAAEKAVSKEKVVETGKPAAKPELPKDIEWLTNDADPVYASPDAKKGGTMNSSILSFPMTFRVVGPDSNGSFRSAILENQLGLIGIHPNTENIIPELATHWAFDKNKKTMYFRLNPKARWSDDKPVTADDFAYTLEFMRSKHIVAPWYNDYYTKEIEKVIVYDDHTLAVVSAKPVPDLHLKLGINPTPRHYYSELDKDFVKKYNWAIVPNTGPYQISDFKKGKYVKFKRKKDWWAKDLRYFKNRFNVDKVTFKVVRDYNVLWEYFKKTEIDVFSITIPKYWHEKTKTQVVENGYVHKIWFFNDTQQSAMGMWLNQGKEIFKDKNLRYAFAHAMNIGRVIEKVLRSDYFRLEHGFMGYGNYTNSTIRARRFDLEKVSHYMKASGWNRGPDGIWAKDGKRFSVEVTYGFEEHTPRLVVLKEEGKKAGVELLLRKLDMAATFKKFLEKKHDVAWMGWSTSLRPQYWEHFHSDNAHKPQTNNITNTDDPEMDKLIDAYRDSLDEKEREELSVKIQAKIHEIGCFVPTFMVPYVRQAYWRWWKLPSPPGTKHSGGLFDPFGSGAGGLFWYDRAIREETKQAVKDKKKLPPVTIIDETYKMKMEN